MTFGDFSAIKPIEIAPGYHARFMHTDTHTFSYVEVEPGKPIPMHSHPHEQISLVQEGEFELTVGDETRVCAPNVPVLIQGDVVHGGRSITACKILDIFTPVREDYKKLSEGYTRQGSSDSGNDN